MKVFISTAEPSGDRIAAALMKQWKSQHTVDFIGVSGPRMRAEGIKSVAQIEQFMAMGITDVLKRLPSIFKARQAAFNHLRGCDICICIDAPDFHLPILKHAKENSILSIGIVSPQIWAWRSGRSTAIAKKMDRLLCLFDFEPALYPSNFDARFVGHPIYQWTRPRNNTYAPNTFALFPGSRPQEISRHLSLYIKTAITLKKLEPSAQFLLSLPKTFKVPQLPDYIQVHSGGAEMAQNVQAALCKSGTITLELACMRVPMVVAHRVNPLTYYLGRLLIRGVQHIALPNILSGKKVVPEFIQTRNTLLLAQELYGLPNHQNINLQPITSKNSIQVMLESIIN